MEQKEKKRRKKKSSRGAYYDYNLLAIVILLICFGLIMLYSTSAYEAQMKFHGDDMYYFRRQALVLQGLYAIGSGGFFGKGLGNSAQKLGTIPEAQNDMIFSIVCEELGVFGAALLLLMFGYLLYRLFFIAQNAPDLYGTLVVTGIFVHIALQVILNLCVVLNLMPTTGITLPFVSYGGTSILFLMAEMGIALSVSGRIQTTGEDITEAETA